MVDNIKKYILFNNYFKKLKTLNIRCCGEIINDDRYINSYDGNWNPDLNLTFFMFEYQKKSITRRMKSDWSFLKYPCQIPHHQEFPHSFLDDLNFNDTKHYIFKSQK